MKIIYEQSNIIFNADVQLYLTKMSFGNCMWRDWGDDPLALLRTFADWGNCLYVARRQG